MIAPSIATDNFRMEIMTTGNGSPANDKKHVRELRKLGWHVITVWECQLKNPDKVLAKLQRYLTTEHEGDFLPYGRK